MFKAKEEWASPCLMKTFHSLMAWHVLKNLYSPRGLYQAFWKVDQHCLKPVRSLFFAVEAQEPSPLFPTRVQSKINIIYLVWICACVHFNLLRVGRRLFSNFCKDLFLDFRCPWQMKSFQPAVWLPLLNWLIFKTMKYYTTTNNIPVPLVSDPSTALAEYFHLFPAVMNLRLLHTGYKSVINKNSD